MDKLIEHFVSRGMSRESAERAALAILQKAGDYQSVPPQGSTLGPAPAENPDAISQYGRFLRSQGIGADPSTLTREYAVQAGNPLGPPSPYRPLGPPEAPPPAQGAHTYLANAFWRATGGR